MGCGASSESTNKHNTNYDGNPHMITGEKTLMDKILRTIDFKTILSNHPKLNELIHIETRLTAQTLTMGRVERQSFDDWSNWVHDSKEDVDPNFINLIEQMGPLFDEAAHCTSIQVGFGHFFVKGLVTIEKMINKHDELVELQKACQKELDISLDVLAKNRICTEEKQLAMEVCVLDAKNSLAKATEVVDVSREQLRIKKSHFLRVYMYAKMNARLKALQDQADIEAKKMKLLLEQPDVDEKELLSQVQNIIVVNGVSGSDGWPVEIQAVKLESFLSVLRDVEASAMREEREKEEIVLLEQVTLENEDSDAELIANLQKQLDKAHSDLRKANEEKANIEMKKIAESVGKEKTDHILQEHKKHMDEQDKQFKDEQYEQLKKLQERIAEKRRQAKQ